MIVMKLLELFLALVHSKTSIDIQINKINVAM